MNLPKTSLAHVCHVCKCNAFYCAECILRGESEEEEEEEQEEEHRHHHDDNQQLMLDNRSYGDSSSLFDQRIVREVLREEESFSNYLQGNNDDKSAKQKLDSIFSGKIMIIVIIASLSTKCSCRVVTCNFFTALIYVSMAR